MLYVGRGEETVDMYRGNFKIEDYIVERRALRHIATVEDERSALRMDVLTDLPGVQFYTANFLPRQRGKGGALRAASEQGYCMLTTFVREDTIF